MDTKTANACVSRHHTLTSQATFGSGVVVLAYATDASRHQSAKFYIEKSNATMQWLGRLIVQLCDNARDLSDVFSYAMDEINNGSRAEVLYTLGRRYPEHVRIEGNGLSESQLLQAHKPKPRRQCVAFCPHCGSFQMQHYDVVWANKDKIAGGADIENNDGMCWTCNEIGIEWAYVVYEGTPKQAWMAHDSEANEVIGSIREVVRKCSLRNEHVKARRLLR